MNKEATEETSEAPQWTPEEATVEESTQAVMEPFLCKHCGRLHLACHA